MKFEDYFKLHTLFIGETCSKFNEAEIKEIRLYKIGYLLNACLDEADNKMCIM